MQEPIVIFIAILCTINTIMLIYVVDYISSVCEEDEEAQK